MQTSEWIKKGNSQKLKVNVISDIDSVQFLCMSSKLVFFFLFISNTAIRHGLHRGTSRCAAVFQYSLVPIPYTYPRFKRRHSESVVNPVYDTFRGLVQCIRPSYVCEATSDIIFYHHVFHCMKYEFFGLIAWRGHLWQCSVTVPFFLFPPWYIVSWVSDDSQNTESI